jgi:DNA-binding transcriptional LysR family regulator
MFISQSALSLTIQSLEKELGQSLFSRTSRGVFPTSFGKTFIRYITPIQTQIRQIDSLFFAGKKKDTLSFILANDGFAVASEVFAKLFQKYRLADVYMKQLENYSNESKNLVSTGQADVGFIRIWTCYKKIEQQQMNAMGLIYQNVATLGLAIGIGPNNPFYSKNLEHITPDMLKNFPLIQHEYMDDGPYEDILARIGIPSPTSRVVTSSRAVVNDLLVQSDAYFISADTTWLYNNSESVPKMIPLESNGVQAELGWIARRGEAMNPVALEYTNLLEQRFI